MVLNNFLGYNIVDDSQVFNAYLTCRHDSKQYYIMG